jgi:peptidoglycan hydrolase-like protein with peptidoglycan-binding domain
LAILIAEENQGVAPSVAACANVTFGVGLTLGSQNSDVKCLQVLLNQSSDTQIASSGVGSPGNETTYFGSLTASAVGKFQVKNGLVSSSANAGYGYVGPQTRAKLNALLGK